MARESTLLGLHDLKYFLNEFSTFENQVISHSSLDLLALLEMSDDLEKWTCIPR